MIGGESVDGVSWALRCRWRCKGTRRGTGHGFVDRSVFWCGVEGEMSFLQLMLINMR